MRHSSIIRATVSNAGFINETRVARFTIHVSVVGTASFLPKYEERFQSAECNTKVCRHGNFSNLRGEIRSFFDGKKKLDDDTTDLPFSHFVCKSWRGEGTSLEATVLRTNRRSRDNSSSWFDISFSMDRNEKPIALHCPLSIDFLLLQGVD